MADTFDIFGKPIKKEVVYVGAGVGAIVVVVLIVRAHQQSAAAAAAAAPADPAATSADESSIDPATGLAAGSPEDLAALASQSSGYYGTPAYDTGGVSSGYYGGSSGAPAGFTNNAAWAQAAEQYITGGSGGGPSDAVGNALGKYITGQGATADQVPIIDQAIAFEGYPPVPGTDGYPPNIRTTTPPTTGGGGTASVTVAVPPIVGLDVEQAVAIVNTAGLKISNAPAGVKGKTHVVTKVSPAAGSKVAKGSKLTITYKTT